MPKPKPMNPYDLDEIGKWQRKRKKERGQEEEEKRKRRREILPWPRKKN